MNEVEVIYVPNGVFYIEKNGDTSIEDRYINAYKTKLEIPMGLRSVIGMNIEEHGQYLELNNKP